MFKYFNCFFSSFFRTLGRIIVYILLGLVFSTILSKIDVHADMATPQEITFDNTTFSTYYEIPVVYTTRDLRIRINDRLRNFSTIGTENTNLILDICASGKLNIWRTSAAGSSCSTSCFSQLIQIKEIPNLTCRTYTYNDNKAYRIVLPINLWNMSGVTSPELDNISFDDKITLSNNTPHDIYASIYGAYYSSIGFDINNQDALFNDLNQTQQNILNKQNEIINNQNNNTNNIIDNQNNNTNNVINNQNENTDKQIDSQKVCKNYDKSNKKEDGYLVSSGNVLYNKSWITTDYINILNSEIEVLKDLPNGNLAYLCFYNVNKETISCIELSTLHANQKINIPNNSYYVRFSIYSNDKTPNSDNRPTFKICQNGNQAISGGLNDINSSINDSSSPDLDGLKNTAGWLPEGPIDSILNLPLTLLNSLTTNLSKSCTPVELPLPYINKNLTLPCLSTIYTQIDGLSVWVNSIGVIASAFILFQYLMNLYKWVDDTLSFRENNFIDNWTGV